MPAHATQASATPSTAASDVQVIELTADHFAFAPAEIHVRRGTTLELRLHSDETGPAHGFRIVGTKINVRVPKRGKGVQTVRFTPDKAGRYAFECSKICGAGHAAMRGVIIVDE